MFLGVQTFLAEPHVSETKGDAVSTKDYSSGELWQCLLDFPEVIGPRVAKWLVGVRWRQQARQVYRCDRHGAALIYDSLDEHNM